MISALQRAIAEIKQRWSVDSWPKIYYLGLLRASEGTLSLWSRLYLQSLAPTNPHWACVVGYGPFSLCVTLKEGLCPSSRDINRLIMITLTLCLQMSSRGISYISPKHLHLSKWLIYEKYCKQVVCPSPFDRSPSQVWELIVLTPFTTCKKGRGAILLFCPVHHTRLYKVYYLEILRYLSTALINCLYYIHTPVYG
jgi:hypothetical protein